MQNNKLANPNRQLLQPFYQGAGRPVQPSERGRQGAERAKGDPASAAVSSYPVPGSGRFTPANWS